MGVMERKDTDKFDIRFDDTPPEGVEAAETAEMENRRLDRLGRRVTLVAILIPILVGLLLLAAYLNVKKRVDRIDTTGTTEVKKVSQDLESTFSALSVQVAKMEEEFSGRLGSLEKSLSSATRKLADVESRIQRLEEGKADLQVMSSALEKQEKTASSLQNALDESRADQEKLGQQLRQALEAVEQSSRQIENVQTEIKALEAEVAAVSGLRPDLKVFELAVKNEQQALAKKLERTTGELKAQIEEIDARLTTLSRKLASEKTTPLVGAPDSKPAAPSPAPGSGGIVEQDIK